MTANGPCSVITTKIGALPGIDRNKSVNRQNAAMHTAPPTMSAVSDLKMPIASMMTPATTMNHKARNAIGTVCHDTRSKLMGRNIAAKEVTTIPTT